MKKLLYIDFGINYLATISIIFFCMVGMKGLELFCACDKLAFGECARRPSKENMNSHRLFMPTVRVLSLIMQKCLPNEKHFCMVGATGRHINRPPGLSREQLIELQAQLLNPSNLTKSFLALPVIETPPVPGRVGATWVPKPRLGEIRDTMVAVLLEEGDYLKVADIHARIEEKLGRSVGYQNVRDFLNHRSRGEKQLFERGDWGFYRIGQ